MKCQFCNANIHPKVTENGVKYCPKCELILGGKGVRKNDWPVAPKGGTGTVKPSPPPAPPYSKYPAFLAESQRLKSSNPKSYDMPKDTQGKYQPHLVCATLNRAVARVREYGVRKYHGEDGWKQQTAMDYMDAIGRHYDECRNNPISRDTESGLLHIAQIATNAMFILQMLREQGVDLDVMNNPPEVK